MQEALVYHDDGSTEADYDVTGMLKHLRIDEDSSMAFADFEGAWKFFFHDCDEATARSAFERLCRSSHGPRCGRETSSNTASTAWHARSVCVSVESG